MEVIGRVPRVLVVEDQEVIQDLLVTVFKHEGFETTCVGSVAEGVDALERRPDFIVLDLHLPDGQGTQVLRRVRESNLDSKVAVTTGTIDPLLMNEARQLKPDRMLQKPYCVSELAEWIRRENIAECRSVAEIPTRRG